MLELGYPLFKPALFRLDPEDAHAAACAALDLATRIPLGPMLLRREFVVRDPRLQVKCLGMDFFNPVGLAAGYDKNATLVRSWPLLGFGHAELGAVTPRPQPGNPKPRLFRHNKIASLQNAMGFNNDGLDAVKARLERTGASAIPIGINLGKNKDTPEHLAVDDYVKLIQGLEGLCDYFVVNISSPNTPGLRDLLNPGFIHEVFSACLEHTAAPVLLKVSPDGKIGTIVSLCDAAVEAGASGIIATNTTTEYALYEEAKDFGGLSGAILTDKSFEVFRAIARALYGRTTLISVGGIGTAEEAWRRITHGASLVQLYTALIYAGPMVVKNINEGLIKLMDKHHVRDMQSAIGSAL